MPNTKVPNSIHADLRECAGLSSQNGFPDLMAKINPLQALLGHKRIIQKPIQTNQIQLGRPIRALGGSWFRRANRAGYPRLTALLLNIATVIGTRVVILINAPTFAGCFRQARS
jgi:hypothetical protein